MKARRIIALILTCIMLSTSASSVFASNLGNSRVVDDKRINDVFSKYIDSVMRHDAKRLMELYAPTIRDMWNFSSCVENRIGIMSIEKMAIQEIREITYQQATSISAYISENDTSPYDNARFFYVGFFQELSHETDLFWNGVVYQVFQLVESDSLYYILDNQYIYDFSWVAAADCAFNSDSERQAAYVQEQHLQRNLINYYGEQIIPYEPYIIDGSKFLKDFSQEWVVHS